MIETSEWMAIWISLKAASVAVAGSLPLAIMAGYFLARWEGRGKTVIEKVINMPLVLPPIVTGYLLLYFFGKQSAAGLFLEQTLGIRITFTWLGAAVAGAVVGFPLMVRAIQLSFQSINPRLEMAALGLGASPPVFFFTISLPLVKRGVVTGAVLGFARSLGEFGATMMTAGNIEGQTQTIPLAIFSEVQRPGGIEQSWRLVLVSIVIASLALIASERLDRKERIHGADLF